ncbi:MAG: DUF2510 domain-containing protein, partial [Microbacteriaceae bacterium]|nr:DUF2510 domain-containing protein [Microbacteriaceae bacterium]
MFADDETVPAGWYSDPMGLPHLRWWDNNAWTELTTQVDPPLVVKVATRLPFADDELPTRRQQRERDEKHAALATDEDHSRGAVAEHAPLSVTLREIDAPAAAKRPADPTVVNLDPIDHDPVAPGLGDGDSYLSRPAFISPRGSALGSPTVTRRTGEPPASDDGPADAESFGAIPRGRSVSCLPIYTAQVWIIALIPLLLLVLSLLLLLGFGSSLNMWVAPTIGLLSYVTTVILAIFDRIALGRAGYEHRASWAWALLTAPIYLLTRSMSLSRVGPLGFAPVLVWTALGILQVGSVLVVPGLIISALPNVFTIQAEQSIAADASIIGAKITVDCTKPLPVIVGQ